MDRSDQTSVPPVTAHISAPGSPHLNNTEDDSQSWNEPNKVERSAHAGPIDWRKKMSDHIAYALLTYTALQIFITIGSLKTTKGASLLPYFALIVLVLAIIPACRNVEARWNSLTDEQAHDPDLAPRYKRDRLLLWIVAIGLPFALTGTFKLLAMLFI